MLLRSDILNIVNSQQNIFDSDNTENIRESIKNISDDYFQILVISGIRNSGKTSLLFQLQKERFTEALYINFEHPRFYNFDENDLYKLDEIINEKGNKTLFFDEVQQFVGWKNYVRQKLEEGFKVVVTASETTLFNNQIDSGFTGLSKNLELFPFSFNEYCAFYEYEKDTESVLSFMKKGGFASSFNSNSEDYLNHLFNDLVVREIAMRCGVRDLRGFKRLAIHLLSNVGQFVTGNQLKTFLGIKTTSTVMEYLSYLESGYLFYYLSKFSYSIRKQMVNPRKVYAIDTGLINANSVSFADSSEPLLENLVFMHLRRKACELYYYVDKFSCDFVVQPKDKVELAIQVCFELKQDNLDAELNGLFEAMEFFDLQEGTVVTMNQSDRFEKNGKVVNVIPFHDFN
jgi:predicted AAA+ superfamily ATPase